MFRLPARVTVPLETQRLGQGCQAIVFPVTLSGRTLAVRVLKYGTGPDLDPLYRAIVPIMGAELPTYYGATRVLVPLWDPNGVGGLSLQERRGYFFDIVPNNFIKPTTGNIFNATPAIRTAVVQALRAARDRLLNNRPPYYLSDLGVGNYTFDPNTGRIMFYPDDGLFRRDNIPSHTIVFDKEVDRWEHPRTP